MSERYSAIFTKKGPGRFHKVGRGRVKTIWQSLLSQLRGRMRNGIQPHPTGGRATKSYRGRKRNDFFGRLPVGNTTPETRFQVRP